MLGGEDQRGVTNACATLSDFVQHVNMTPSLIHVTRFRDTKLLIGLSYFRGILGEKIPTPWPHWQEQFLVVTSC